MTDIHVRTHVYVCVEEEETNEAFVSDTVQSETL